MILLYSYEIENYLREHNYSLTAEECAGLMNVNINTQIVKIKYYPFEDNYQVDTSDGYCFRFKVNKRKGFE